MRELASKGQRLESIQTAKQYRLNQGFNSDIFCEEIINLLCTGQQKRARRLFQKYFPTNTPLSPLAWKLDRFLFPETVQELGQTTLQQTRTSLHRHFDRHYKSSPYLRKLLRNFSHYILISNSSLIKLGKKDRLALRQLPRPLFIYQNIGNPLLLKKRKSFYNRNAKELILGGFKNIADAEGKLLFQPYSSRSLIGCLTRVNPKLNEIWHASILPRMLRSNPGVQLSLIEEALLVDSLYPISICREQEPMQKRICTNGWLALSLFEALATYQPNRPIEMLTIGFDLSPSYVFEACRSIDFHDFGFERHCLDMRHKHALVNRFGKLRRNNQELTTAEHMAQAGVERQKLADFRRQNGRWPGQKPN